MVGGPLTKKLLRDIRGSLGQFIAASAVVFLATAVFVSFQITYHSLLVSRDSYYERYLFADFFLELEKAPVSALRDVESLPGVWRARGRIVEDVPLDLEGAEGSIVGRLISMPRRRDGLINDVHLVTGSYFPGSSRTEVIVNQRFCEANGLRVGDTFQVTINERKEDLQIVGTAYSPEYVYPLRGPEQFAPDDAGFALVFARESFVEDAFNMTNAFNNVSGLLRPGTDAEGVLEKIEARLDRYGVYHKYSRADQLSNHYLSQELEGLRKSAVIVPVIFLIVAAVVTHIIVRRITELQRTQIGLLGALGYSKLTVVAHYVCFALAIAMLGTVPGTGAGYWLGGQFLKMYQPYFRFPALSLRWDPEAVLTAFLLSCGMCVTGAVHSALRILSIQPAQALRPAPPASQRAFHRGLLAFIWDRLPVVWRITLRNSIRVRARTFFSIGGVAVAMMMLVVSMMNTSVFDFIIEHQFSKVDRSDVRVDFVRERREAAILEVARVEGVGRAEGMLQIGAELRNGWREKTVLVMGLPREGRLYRIYDTAGRHIPVPPDGLVIPRRLAKWLDLRPGSRVWLDPYLEDKDERRALVRGVVDQYVGLTVYADRDYLAGMLGEGGLVNGALATAERGRLDQVVERLDDIPGIRAVGTPRAMMQDLRESIADIMRTAAVIQTIAAGIIAFAVIYNASSVNIAEQERDLATLRSLGYSPGQVAGVATDDIMPLTVLGILGGIPLAVLACQGIAKAYETDIYKIPVVIDWSLFANAAIWLMIFSLIARWACRRRVYGIDIVRRLKTRE